ncbi:MAG: sulfotransferase [Geodermatophilaceae bacterium]|nr:sulfotransferase [Geodermatophilaceae bacterium]MDQ3477368.1 sulfotransferase [Actinomycetota bacterium]
MSASTTRPNFLVAGAARSGTTALVEGVRNHPRVFVTQPKEPHYFALHGQVVDFRGPGDAATINRVAVTDYEGYLGLYPADHDYLALGDGSVSTLYYAKAAVPEILRINPEMRLVVILRNPVERAYSAYQYLRARGFEPHEDFMAALDDEPDRIRDDWHHLWHYSAMSRYAEGLQTLREGLGADRVGVWFYDDLDRDPDTTISSVLRFLDVPEHRDETSGIAHVNVSGTPRLAPLTRVIQWATTIEPLRQLVKKSTSFGFREFVRRHSLRPSAVPAAARARLEPLFADDLRQVADLLGDSVSTPAWLPPRGQSL